MPKQVVSLLISFFILCAVFVFGERTFSPTFQQCIATHQTNENDSAAKKNQSGFGITIDSYVRCSGAFVQTYQSGIAALATIIIAAFTGTLWVATSRQAELTREALIADKRAFVFAKAIQPFWERDAATGHFNWRVSAVWENSGDTPTQGLELYVDGVLSNTMMTPNFDFTYIDPAAPPGAGMLGPKAIATGGQAPHFPRSALTPQDIVDMQNARKFFYLWGWAKYSDALPDTPPHITRFCWLILVTGDPFAFNPTVDANSVRFFNLYQGRGNCADDECVRQGLG